MRSFTIALVVAALLTSPAHAQESHSMAWLEGCWTGQVFGGVATECWMTASDDLLVGSFMLVSDGELTFTEHLMIGEANGVRGYHVKHFTPDFIGWESREEMVTFRFRAVGENRIDWEGVVYEFDGSDEITISLDQENSDGEVETIVFTLTRLN